MGVQSTFTALRRVRSRHVAPALLASLDADGYDALRVAAVRMLASTRDESAHRALLYRYDELPQDAQAAIRAAASALRSVIREALKDGDEIRGTALSILETSQTYDIADLLAEYLADDKTEYADRAEEALRRIVGRFLSEREEATEPEYGPEGEEIPVDTRKLRQRAKVSEHARLLFRAMTVATEMLPQNNRTWVVEACLDIGGECRALLNEALRIERERREPGPVEKHLSENNGVRALEYLMDRLVDHRAEIRTVAQRALSSKRGPEVNTNLAWVLEERVSDERLHRIVNIWDGIPFMDVIDGCADRYSAKVLNRLLRETQRAIHEPALKARVLGVLAEGRDRDLHKECLTALESMPEDATGPVFERLARARRHDLAMHALRVLIERNHPGVLKVAAGLLDAPWADVREEAARFIATRAYKRYLDGFDKMTEEQRRAGGAGLRHVDDTVIEDLQRQISAAEPEVRLRALRLLNLTSNVKRLSDSVLQLMRDPDARVRATVVGMLGDMRSGEAVKAIGKLLDDPDDRVRANAIEAIEALGERSLARALVPFLKDDNNRIRANAAKALFSLGVDEAAEIMRAMLAHENPLMRMSAAWAIRETNPAGGREWLTARLRDEADDAVRQRIETALKALDNRKRSRAG